MSEKSMKMSNTEPESEHNGTTSGLLEAPLSTASVLRKMSPSMKLSAIMEIEALSKFAKVSAIKLRRNALHGRSSMRQGSATILIIIVRSFIVSADYLKHYSY